MRALLTLLLLLVSACAQPAARDFGPFKDYVVRFEAAADREQVAVRVENLRMELADLGSAQTTEAGQCVSESSDAPPTIQIDRALWNEAGEDAKEALIFHELGHCVLSRNHVSVFGQDHRPRSLMVKTGVSGGDYRAMKSGLVHELFHPGEWEVSQATGP